MGITIKAIGKYLDQPALVDKLSKSVNYALPTIALGYGVYDSFNAPKEQRKKKFIQNMSVLSFTVAGALLATRGLKIGKKEIFEGLCEPPELEEEAVKEVFDKYKGTKVEELINDVKDGKILGIKNIKTLINEINDKDDIKKIIPDAESEAPFADLAKLSWVGFLPVVGGVTGGVIGDVLTKDSWKKKFPNKVKEGTYQYLNNIFLCNVGAGIAMLTMNKMKIQNKAIKTVSILGGVVLVGIVAGSAIANFIGKNFINPIFSKEKHNKKPFKEMVKDLNSERHPEAIDLSLHIDDIASVGFLSGFQWIGPVLPMLYSVSAYRAGIGYRNGKEN